MLNRAHKQIHTAKNSRKAEFILTLQVTSRAPFQYYNVQRILPRANILRNVELAHGIRYLTVSYLFAIDENIKEAVHALEVEIVFLRRVFYLELAAVMECRILHADIRRVYRKRIARIDILNTVVPVHLYARRYGNFFGEFFVHLYARNIFVRLKSPLSVQRNKSVAFRPIQDAVRKGKLLRLAKRDIVTARRLFTYAFVCFVLAIVLHFLSLLIFVFVRFFTVGAFHILLLSTRYSSAKTTRPPIQA